MKVKNPNTGNFEEVYVKAMDNMPIGTEVDFSGHLTSIPVGWERITDPHSYSTSEIKTNKTWIDGKPIYKKTYTGTTPTLSSESWTTLFSISSLSIDELIDIEGMCGTGKLPRYSSSGYYVDIQKTGNNIQVMGTGYNNQPYKITLYYTKTTD